jgi:hypothetical protein
MAHYAYLDDNNIVVDVIVGKDETETINGLDTEAYYALGTPYTVKRTSYNGNIRYNYAGIGFTYDPEADAFIAPKIMPSFVLNDKYQWEPPVPAPENKELYYWDESQVAWVERT